jgi:hypothetical protein
VESNPTETTTKYQPVTVDVPEERVAEFHAFFARFLAGRPGRGRRGRHGRGRHGRPHHGAHGRGCAGRREAAEGHETTGTPADIAEV